MSPGCHRNSEIDADASHQLARWNELITRGAHTEHVGKARIDAVFIGQVLADQLDSPVGVGRRETQHQVEGVVAVDFVSGGVIKDAVPKIAAVGIAQRAVKIAPAPYGGAVGQR